MADSKVNSQSIRSNSVKVDIKLYEKIQGMPKKQQDRAAWLYSVIGKEPTNISSKIVQRVCGSRDTTLLWLAEEELIQKAANYSTVARQCNKYKRIHNIKDSIVYTLEDKFLIKKLAGWKEDRIRNVENEGTRWIVECLDLAEPPLDAWLDGACRNVNWKIEKTGRLDHSFTNLKKQQRAQAVLDCEPVIELDIVSSHLKTIAALFADGQEKRQLMQVGLYDRFAGAAIADAVHIRRWNRKNPNERIEKAKHWLIKCLNSQTDTQLAVVQQFEALYPNCFSKITSYKRKAGTRKFALKLQKLEASLISSTALRLKHLGIPCLSVYDSILVPRSQALVARKAMSAAMLEAYGAYEDHFISGASN